MNYQGVIVRRDLVWFSVVFWFMVTYYPKLSVGLILALLVSTYWESTANNLGVMVNMFSGKITTSSNENKGKSSKKNNDQYTRNLNMAATSATVMDKSDTASGNIQHMNQTV